MLALMRDAEPEDMIAKDALDIVPLWNEARFVLVRMLEGALVGEKYQLTNVSKQRMVIDERELYRRGVIAIARSNALPAAARLSCIRSNRAKWR